MPIHPRKSTIPPTCLAAAVRDGANFHDAWSIHSTHIERSALDHFLTAAQRTPRWVNLAMAARNAIVQMVGLKNLGTLSEIDASKLSSAYQPGERVGIFTLFENTFDEVLLGDRDKHLDVVLSVHRRLLPSGDGVEVTLTTVVHVKNLLGRLYMLPVKPAHRIIAPAVLARIATEG